MSITIEYLKVVLDAHMLDWAANESVLGGVSHLDKDKIALLVLNVTQVPVENRSLHCVGQPR